jgi:hypothetical protein
VSIERIMQGAVGAALSRAAQTTGVDFAQLAATAKRESSFNPNARAATSSAAGLFQFIESTWLEMIGRHGAKHGLASEAAAIDLSGGRPRVSDAATRKAILELRFDPEIAARMAGELTNENASFLRKRIGREPSANELYAAHFLGPRGAARVIEAAQKGVENVAAMFPREAAANRSIFYTKDGAPRSAQGLLDRLALPNAPAAPKAPVAANTPVAPTAPVVQPGGTSVSQELFEALFGLSGLKLLDSDPSGDGGSLAARLMMQAYGRKREL